MLTTFEIDIPGEPLPAPRSRSTRNGERYDGAYNGWLERARTLAGSVARYRGWYDPIDEPMMLTVLAVHRIPISWPEWRRAGAYRGTLAHTHEPSIASLVQAGIDTLAGIVFERAAQVTRAEGIKIYQSSLHPTPALKVCARRHRVVSVRDAVAADVREFEGE